MDRVPASRRRRTIHAWVVAAACLLANQLALVAPVRAMAAPMPGCRMSTPMSMPMRAPIGAGALVALSCASHCAAQSAVPNPPQAAPAPAPLWIVRTAVPAVAAPLSGRVLGLDDPIGSPRAPPRPRALLFCSLLI
jgi:hypothetical protein